MPKIAGRFHLVRAWNGIPGIDVDMAFAVKLRMAGVPVTTYNQAPSGIVRDEWSDMFAEFAPEELPPEPQPTEAYRVATPLAKLAPDADLAIWAAHNYDPEELAAIYKLQERDEWPRYMREMRELADVEDHQE